MPLRLFRSSIFNIAGLIGVVVGVALFGAVSYIGFFLQMVNGASATVSGLLMLPFVGGLLVSSIGSGRICPPPAGTRSSRSWARLSHGRHGTAVPAEPTSTRVENGIYMAVLGFGIGLVMQILVLVVQNAAPREDLGAATAANNYFRQIGGTVGGGIVGAVFTSRLTSKITHLLPPGSGHLPNVQALTPRNSTRCRPWCTALCRPTPTRCRRYSCPWCPCSRPRSCCPSSSRRRAATTVGLETRRRRAARGHGAGRQRPSATPRSRPQGTASTATRT